MFTLAAAISASQEIKRSRFLAIASPVADPDEAKNFIARNSAADANHNCWAWRIGQAYRFSDDGEPSGTAGKPILQVIDGQELDNVAVLVTRWFGGILLGSGGLVRAYGGTAGLCLKAAERRPIIAMAQASIVVQFSDLALVKARLGTHPGLAIREETFTETGAILDVALPEEAALQILDLVRNLTNGRALCTLPDDTKGADLTRRARRKSIDL